MNHPSTSSGPAIPDTHQKQKQQNYTVVQIGQQPVPPSVQSQPNPPNLALLEGSRADYIKFAVPLYKAAMRGDWEAAKPILDEQPYLIRCAITDNHETLLHIAVSAEWTKAAEEFVINLVHMMGEKDLELQNKSWDTALSSAAAAGNIKATRIMVKKNPGLTEIANRSREMPLYIAALSAKPMMVRYLYSISNKMAGDFWSHDNRGLVLQKCVEADIFDVAIQIVYDRPELTSAKKGFLSDILLALAHKTYAFRVNKSHFIFTAINSIFAVPEKKEPETLHLLRIIWEKVATMHKSEIDDILRGPPLKLKARIVYPFRALFVAAQMGNKPFIIELTRLYPEVIWIRNDEGKTIFHTAVEHRQIEIYKLIYETGSLKNLVTHIKDQYGNNMLHMVGKSVEHRRLQNTAGAALQMQSELLWFLEVEQLVPPQIRLMKNYDGKTPLDLFSTTHEKLLNEGKQWMKETASQCMVVATLIATIVFAAAFTLPGGYNQETGIPFFSREPSVIIFVISDAISLLCSSTSVLVFLSIFTSRNAERDFLVTLPRKLVNGIAILFIAVVTMMIAFSASFFALYHKNQKWMPITITTLASIPVIYFFKQRDLFKVAYGPYSQFKRTHKPTLYN